jgi:nitrite reductase (NO-forming)
MSIIRMPANLILPTHRANRRQMIRGAAGLGLGIGAAGGFGRAFAQDHSHAQEAATPEDAVGGAQIGSDASQESTGDATPSTEVQETPFEWYDPYLPAVEPGDKEVAITAMDRIVEIKKGMKYAAWTFDGTVPARPIRAVQGDTVHVTVKNEANMTHSVDFHSAQVSPENGYRNVAPGDTFEWDMKVDYPGAYMVHCGTAPVLMHIAAGMYLPMIVDPAEGGFEPAQEIVLSQSEFYPMEGENEVYVTDTANLFENNTAPQVMAFNGHASQYVDQPIKVKAGELVRIYFVNMGPNVWSSFHIVGAIFSHVYMNANPKNAMEGMQGVTVGPGDGVAVETTFAEPGVYIAVNHAFGHATHGAMALIEAE